MIKIKGKINQYVTVLSIVVIMIVLTMYSTCAGTWFPISDGYGTLYTGNTYNDFMTVNTVAHAGMTLPDGSPFDPDYYRTTYNLTGSDEEMANHYWYYGIPEGKLPYAGASDVSATSLLNAVNEYRVANGLTPYAFDTQLQGYAQLRARELADASFFAHTRPDGNAWKTTFGDNYTNYRRLGENLARGQSSSVIVVARWQKSVSHNAVMLDTKCNIAGVGVAKSADGMFYYCLIVGLTK